MASDPIQITDPSERMHVVTVQFAIVLDGECPVEHELADLHRAIGILYGGYGDIGDGPGPHPDPTFFTPNGEWQIVDVTPSEDLRDLDPPSAAVIALLPEMARA